MQAGEHRQEAAGESECAAVAAHLVAVFRHLSPDVVRATVCEAERELHGQVAPGSQAELVHRLAQCRLGGIRAGGYPAAAADDRRP